MDRQEFYEQAQKLRDQYSKGTFEGKLISFIVYSVFNNGEELPKKIEFEYRMDYCERGEYKKRMEKVTDELGLVCEYIACALTSVYIIGPKFK